MFLVIAVSSDLFKILYGIVFDDAFSICQNTSINPEQIVELFRIFMNNYGPAYLLAAMVISLLWILLLAKLILDFIVTTIIERNS